MKKPTKSASPMDRAPVSKEAQEKQKALSEMRVGHTNLTVILEDLMGLLMPHSGSNIIVITGPTGAGKTTLTRNLLGKLDHQFAPELAEDASAIPLVAVEAYANGESRHSFKPVFQDILAQLLEPGTERKTCLEQVNGRLVVTPQRRETIASLRQIVESALKSRKTKVCVIDEAYHLMRFGHQSAVMDTLKSLANTTGIKLVLVGSFDLFDLVADHGQIARRTAILNLDRYRLDSKSDRAEFKEIVVKLMTNWPCDVAPNFAAISDDLLEVSFGCVGLLKTLMLEASAMQIRNDGKWVPKFLSKAAKSNGLRKVIGKEIEAGEAKIRDSVFGESLWDEKALKALQKKMDGEV